MKTPVLVETDGVLGAWVGGGLDQRKQQYKNEEHRSMPNRQCYHLFTSPEN
jgi:hypothetical protein